MITEVQGFVGGAYSLPTKQIAAQECINLYVEKVEAADKEGAVLLPTPGMKYFATGQSGSQPAASIQNGLYAASTGQLFYMNGESAGIYGRMAELKADGTWNPPVAASPSTLLGTPVGIADNGNWIMVVQGAASYVLWDINAASILSTTEPTISDCKPTHVAYLDGYFIINKPGTNQMFTSPVDWSSGNWNPLSFASAEQSPDNITGLIVSGRDLWVFGPLSVELWYDAGTAPFPFARNTSVAFQIGLYAKYSLAQTQGSVFWLGGGAEGYGIIYRSVGYTPTRISTHAIEREIRTYAGIDDAYGFTYQENGHSFYVITFQTGNATWCYDLTTGLWHRRMYLNPATGAYERWRAIGLAAFNGKTFVLDRTNLLNIYQLDSSTYTDAGDQILRVRTSPHVHSGMEWIFINRFQLDMQVGQGLSTGQGSDPQMILEYSKDGGSTWSAKLYRSMGKIGQFLTRVYWNRLGKARDIVFRVSTSEPVKVSIMGAYVDADA